METPNTPAGILTEKFMRKFSQSHPDECIINLEPAKYNKVYEAVYELIRGKNLIEFLNEKEETVPDEALIPPPKADRNNIIKVIVQLGRLQSEEDETYFVPNFVRHIELTGINDIKFDADTLKQLGIQFTMAVRRLRVDYERSA
jgi:hypothetical protein